MGDVDFNGIFFGHHHRHHRLATVAILALAALIGVYQLWNVSGGQTTPDITKQQASAQYGECAEFQIVAGEISCGDAAKLALERFGGDITKITHARIGTRPQAGAESALRDVWSVEINLKSPYQFPNGKTANSIAVQVDRSSKNILAFKMV